MPFVRWAIASVLAERRSAPPTGFQPVVSGLFRLPGLPEMVRQHLRCDALPTFERRGDARVQLLPARPQQRRICRILDQCMLEDVIGVRRETALKHQLRTDS